MLQAVVTKQKGAVGVGRQQGAAGLRAGGGDEHGQAAFAAQQQGFVAHFGHGAVRVHLAAIGAGATVAARDDAGPPAAGLKVARQGEGDGRFARAAGHDVAHDDDGHGQALGGGAGAGLLAGGQHAVETGQGPQAASQRAALLPGGGEGAFKGGAQGHGENATKGP